MTERNAELHDGDLLLHKFDAEVEETSGDLPVIEGTFILADPREGARSFHELEGKDLTLRLEGGAEHLVRVEGFRADEDPRPRYRFWGVTGQTPGPNPGA